MEAHSLIIYAPDLGIQPTYVLAQSDPLLGLLGSVKSM